MAGGEALSVHWEHVSGLTRVVTLLAEVVVGLGMNGRKPLQRFHASEKKVGVFGAVVRFAAVVLAVSIAELSHCRRV